MDEEITSSRSGKEDIIWRADLLASFKRIQPLSVTIPHIRDVVYLAIDACTSLPAGGTKMILNRLSIWL